MKPLLERGIGGMFSLDPDVKYLGPLPRNCGHAHQRNMGSDAAKARLAKMAAYPQQMNDWIAEAIVTECLGPSPPAGGGAMTSVPCTRGYVGDILDSKHLDPKVDRYSGRGDQSKGPSPSPLAKPWKTGVHGDRDEVVETFTDSAHNNALIRLGARALGGRRLWCHCRPHERCHGDVLAELHAREAQDLAAARPGPVEPFNKGQAAVPVQAEARPSRW